MKEDMGASGASCAASLRENADNLKAWIDSLVSGAKEEQFWGRFGLEQQAEANFMMGIRLAASLKAAMEDIAAHIEAAPHHSKESPNV